MFAISPDNLFNDKPLYVFVPKYALIPFLKSILDLNILPRGPNGEVAAFIAVPANKPVATEYPVCPKSYLALGSFNNC